MQLNGESVLAALVLLAEQTGEHFRLSASGRRIEWLRAAQTASGLRAVQGDAPGSNTMLIADLAWSVDTYAMYNRIYAYGGGDGPARLTLANSTSSVPAGYAIDRTVSYIENQTAQATYGRIDTRETFSDITPVDTSTSARKAAANALLDRALIAVRRASQAQHPYDLTVVPSTYRIYPGNTIKVIWDEWVDSFHAVAINATLVVLEVTTQISEDQADHSPGTVSHPQGQRPA